MTRQEKLDRRRFLKAVGTAATTLPCYRMMEDSAAGQTNHPLRLITFMTHNGYWRPFWWPQASSPTDWTLVFPNSALAPLEKFKSKLLLPEGIDCRVNAEKDAPRYSGHEIGPVTCFTATACLNPNGSVSPRGPSIDQYLAEKLGASTPLRSLRLTVGGHSSSFDNAGKRSPAINRPSEAFRLLFSSAPAGASDPAAAETARRSQERHLSVVSALQADVNDMRLRPRLATTERLKLDEHLQALAEIEKRLRAPAPSVVAGCRGAGATPPAEADSTNGPAKSRAHADLLTQALACDLTRFAHFNIHTPGWGAMPWLGFGNCHDIAHALSDRNVDATLRHLEIMKWYAGELAYLLEKLASVPEGTGTLLDHVVIVWGNELANPATHSNTNMPFVLAGGANRKLRMGTYVNYNADIPAGQGGFRCTDIKPSYPGCSSATPFVHQRPHNGLYVAIAQAFGIQTEVFGDPDYKGALPGLLA